MKTDLTQIVGYLAIAVIIISLFFISIRFTGYDVTSNQTGLVNVTISGAGALNFTTSLLDFGSGSVVSGTAVLQSNGTGLNTSWSGVKTTGELVLENIGNVNVSLTLSTNGTVGNFIGGTSPSFKAMTADKSGNTGACSGATETFDGAFAEINQSLQTACSVFGFAADYDEIDIDFELHIPNDAVGAKTVGIVAIGTY